MARTGLFPYRWVGCVLAILGAIVTGCGTQAPPQSATAGPATPAIVRLEGQVVVVADVASLRAAPDTEAPELARVFRKDTLTLQGRDPTGDWYLVQSDALPAGGEGAWILARFVIEAEAFATLAADSGPGLAASSPTATATLAVILTIVPTTLPLNPPTPTTTATEAPSSTPEPPAATATEAAPAALFIQNGHCRRGPSQVYDIVTSLRKDERAAIVGRNRDSTWWLIQLPNSPAKCWVSAVVVETSGSTGELQIVAAPPTPTLVPPPSPTSTVTLIPAFTPTLTATTTPPPSP